MADDNKADGVKDQTADAGQPAADKDENKDEREENVLTNDDFNSIESEFGKKEGLMDKIFKKHEKKKSEDKKEELPVNVDDVSSKIMVLVLMVCAKCFSFAFLLGLFCHPILALNHN